jgi:hypothetical protein
MVKDNYLQRMLNRGANLEEISVYIDIDYNLEVKQKDKMLRAIEKEYNQLHQDQIDNILFDMLEVLENTPEKWTVSLDGSVIVIYPHPIVTERHLTGIEYKHHKNYYFEDTELFEGYCRLQDEIAKTSLPKKKRGRKVKPSSEIVQKWVNLKQQGVKYSEIAKKYGVRDNIVRYQILKKLNEVS